MLEDRLYKLARKNLSGELYSSFSRSLFGRSRSYDNFTTFSSIFRYYINQGLDFSEKVVLEVGAGNQFFTPFLFLSAGARTVLIAEPRFSWERFDHDLEAFNRESGKALNAEDARKRIHGFHTMGEITAEWNASVDVICSHNVLEHFTDLSTYFMDTARLLSPSGIAFNKVDLSDHTYHIFSRYPFTRWLQKKRMIYHLRYSKREFDRLNDPKCFMNRILLPHYLASVKGSGLKVRGLTTEPLPPSAIHEDLVTGIGELKSEELYIAGFGLTVSR